MKIVNFYLLILLVSTIASVNSNISLNKVKYGSGIALGLYFVYESILNFNKGSNAKPNKISQEMANAFINIYETKGGLIYLKNLKEKLFAQSSMTLSSLEDEISETQKKLKGIEKDFDNKHGKQITSDKKSSTFSDLLLLALSSYLIKYCYDNYPVNK